MKTYIEERAIEIANYMIENNATVRQAAKNFGISKSTVHKDVTERLEQVNPSLAAEARKVIDVNKSERHIRGGMATKEKYAHQHGGNQYPILRRRYHLAPRIHIGKRVYPADNQREGIVDKMHEHSQPERTGTIIYVSEQHSEKKSRNGLPRIEVNESEEKRRAGNGPYRSNPFSK